MLNLGVYRLHSTSVYCMCVYRRHAFEQLEIRNSDVRKELVTLKEVLSQLNLQKEVLEDEKRSLTQALSRVIHSHTST